MRPSKGVGEEYEARRFRALLEERLMELLKGGDSSAWCWLGGGELTYRDMLELLDIHEIPSKLTEDDVRRMLEDLRAKLRARILEGGEG